MKLSGVASAELTDSRPRAVPEKRAVAELVRPPVWQVAVIQLLVLLPLGAILGVADASLALSWVSGGMVAVISHLYFSACAFRYYGAVAAAQVTRSFFRGEAGKFVLTLVGFACVFSFIPEVRGVAVFSGYLLMLVLQICWTARLTRDL